MIGNDFTILSDTLQDGVRHITAQPSALVCSQQIDFDLDAEGKIHNLKYIRGCNGNLKAIGRLVEGQDAAAIASTLRGNDCNGRGTSCADQLAQAIELALEEEKKKA